MHIDLLSTILKEELEASEADGTYTIPDAHRTTILVAGPSDLVPVPKVRSVRICGDYLDLTTESGHFYVALDAVFAVKSEGDASRQEKRPGFH